MTTSAVSRAESPTVPRNTAALVVGGLALVYVLTHLLLLSRFPWFIDETIFGRWAQTVEGARDQRFIALLDHKGLINSWIGAVFIHLGAAPVVAMRLLSMLSGLVAAAGTGLVVHRWRGLRDGCIAGALALFVPYLFVHGAVGVHDEFIAAGSIVALALQLSLARRPRLDRTLLLGFTFGLLLLSKPTGAIAIALLPLSLAVFDWRAPGHVQRLATWAASVALALGIALAMYALTFLSPLAYQPAPDNHRTLSDLFSDPFANLGAIAPDAFAAVTGYMTLPILAAALWGAGRAVWTRDAVGIVLLGWVLVPLAAFLLLTDSAYPRYGLQLAAPLCALAAAGGVDLWQRLRAFRSPRVAWIVTALALLPMVVFDAQVVIAPKHAPYAGLDRDQYVSRVSNQQPAREAAELIVARAPTVFTAATPPSDRTVAVVGGWDYPANLVLNGRRWAAAPRFTVLDPLAPVADLNAARYAIVEGTPLQGFTFDPTMVVRRWTRPDGGPGTMLIDRRATPEQ